MDKFNYEDIRPYNISEIKKAVKRIKTDKTFFKSIKFLFPEFTDDIINKKLDSINSVYDFQKEFMHIGIRRIIDKFSDGLEYNNFNYLDKNTPYLFISNHRDIFLDSGILQVILFENNFDTTQITFGNNLMYPGLITDIGKINKMFTVYRGGNAKEFYNNSLRLSSYIRHVITEKKTSVWIAQRNGRTKNGYDETQIALIKMLMSSEKDFTKSIKELNIIPVSVSYEYEPCDNLKTNEIYISQTREYIKTKDEDLKSILQGVIQQKGKITLNFGKPLNNELNGILDIKNKNKKVNLIKNIIDKSIYANYKLYANNFIAFDILNKTDKYKDKYTDNEKQKFNTYVDEKIKYINGNKNTIKNIFLDIYANPVVTANLKIKNQQC